ncbi:MAG TPA: YtxH domain-containing protein [Thermomicrobiales bacterium]|jgi:gas vesicle protein|nr:YtxH domain-containing protein [Thermomicrobiales bacterium]
MDNLVKSARRQFSELDMRKREDEAASRGFIGGLALGILVGAILALIFAPRTGSETRGMVAGTATDLKHKATDMVHQVKSDETANGPAATGLGEEPAIEREIGDVQNRPTPGVI